MVQNKLHKHYAKGKKPNIKDHVFDETIYMKSPKKANL